MNDLELAIKNLEGHSICLCRGRECLTDDSKGISPMMKFIEEGRDLSGFSAADAIVGKAAAMLFVKAKISTVYGKVMSISAKAFLETNGIPCSYGTLTDKIINRMGTDICPMEKTVADINDADEAYEALKTKLISLKQNRKAE